MIIYLITNKVNNKTYVGKTNKTLEERFKKHFYNHKDLNTYLYKSMRKYGFESFKIELLEQVTENINDREIFWINLLKPDYNLTKGGDGGDTSKSINFKNSIKIFHSKRIPSDYATYGMLGKKQSDKFFKSIKNSNSVQVICEGIKYNSVGEAEKAYPGISLRKRLDSNKYPEFYRLKIIKRK